MAGSSITCAVAHWADCRDCDKLNLGWEVYFPWHCSINHLYSCTQAYKPHGVCVYKSLNRWLALNFTSTLYIHGECSHGPLFNVVSFCCSFCKTQMIHFSYLLWDGKVRSNVAQKYIDSKCASVLLYCLPLGFPELCWLTCWSLYGWMLASSEGSLPAAQELLCHQLRCGRSLPCDHICWHCPSWDPVLQQGWREGAQVGFPHLVLLGKPWWCWIPASIETKVVVEVMVFCRKRQNRFTTAHGDRACQGEEMSYHDIFVYRETVLIYLCHVVWLCFRSLSFF